ncbi:putative phiE125 gp8 family phage protein [Rhodoligotrophos appendicifer]|uniref:head-tail connector protein n=1 Tax=Rhodoligotrophos appendicifer TaxID=987056 RepID=UPI001186A25D|nr:head-tail connector protein [Rhodoligotrophos appendicifer]
MVSICTQPPAIEPVTVEEARAHLRVDGAEEDAMIGALITAARVHLESATRRVFITQGWSVFLDQWPISGVVALPVSPVQTVDAVKVYGDDDAATLVDPDIYGVDPGSRPRLRPRAAAGWPLPGRALRGIEIQLTAGFGDTAPAVPAPIRLAILQLVAHWFEQREPAALGDPVHEVPRMVRALVDPYRALAL